MHDYSKFFLYVFLFLSTSSFVTLAHFYHFSEGKSLRIRIWNDASVNIHMVNYSHIL